MKELKHINRKLYPSNRKIFSEAISEYDLKPRQLSAIKEWVKNGGNVKAACREVGVQRRTWYNWRVEEPFRLATDFALSEIKRRREIDDMDKVQEVENALYKNAVENGKENSQIFYLKNRAPERWQNDYVQGQTYIQNQKNTLNIYNGDFQGLSNEELVKEVANLTENMLGRDNSKKEGSTREPDNPVDAEFVNVEDIEADTEKE